MSGVPKNPPPLPAGMDHALYDYSPFPTRPKLAWPKGARIAFQVASQVDSRTILDANLTTLISAVFLFQFGTGPVKGFAVTLVIGLLANVFTAVWVSRVIFDWTLSKAAPQEALSI